MQPDQPALDIIRDARARVAGHLADLHRIHIALADETRAMKGFAFDGRAKAEIEVTSEMLEQYLAATNGFLENMHGRFELRLSLLRRGGPSGSNTHEDAVGHAEFWLAFSRLTAVLHRAGRAAEV